MLFPGGILWQGQLLRIVLSKSTNKKKSIRFWFVFQKVKKNRFSSMLPTQVNL